MSNITIVTGLWDIKRSDLKEGWARDYENHYIKNFKKFLEIPNNLIIFGDKELKKVVETNKTHNNVQFIERDLEWFKGQFFNDIQRIRNNPKWYNMVGWLKDSTQAKLEMYNPIVMQKMFLLNDAAIMDKFDSKYMFWLDAGITNTVHPGYFTHDKVLYDLPEYINNFSFITFPYKAEKEIHGFDYSKICNICNNNNVNKVARGGFFGGLKEEIGSVMSDYYTLMDYTLKNGLMGTEESLFTILIYQYPQKYSYFEIDGNGLISKFFENLKNKKLKEKREKFDKKNSFKILKNKKKTSLYVITFNSPKQFETLIESFYSYDADFIDRPKKYLLNNSTDKSTDIEYNLLCEEYGFEQLRFEENLGICGGRQYIAEHFDKSDSEYMFFFEDDMFLYNGKKQTCKNGYNRYVNNLYEKSLDIINHEEFDFLKLSFTEFYGDNSTQWAWYNVPNDFRVNHWPDKPFLPERGLDPNPPKVKYNNIKTYRELPYVDGEIYYCNWPQIVSKSGNKKMFLTEKWDRPFEQTWMSYIYQKTISGDIKPAICLTSPIEHDRFEHYDRKLRKES